jgi:hypothetical protein
MKNKTQKMNKFLFLTAVFLAVVVIAVTLSGVKLYSLLGATLLYAVPGLIVLIWWEVCGQGSTDLVPGQEGYQSPQPPSRLLEARQWPQQVYPFPPVAIPGIIRNLNDCRFVDLQLVSESQVRVDFTNSASEQEPSLKEFLVSIINKKFIFTYPNGRVGEFTVPSDSGIPEVDSSNFHFTAEVKYL